jgi:hypothetical protein
MEWNGEGEWRMSQGETGVEQLKGARRGFLVSDIVHLANTRTTKPIIVHDFEKLRNK